MDTIHALAPAVLFLPLAGAVVIALLGPFLPRAASAWLANAAMLAAFVLTALIASALRALPAGRHSADWTLGAWVVAHGATPLSIGFGLRVDETSLLWMLVITGVGFLIHLYSVGYMAHDAGYRTFFAHMNLFAFAMLLLVMADNFVWLLVGWGGVGLASYLLIGFYFTKPSAVDAARKALIMNVIGDVGMMIALFIMYRHIASPTGDVLSFATVFSSAPHLPPETLTAIGLWLFVACAAKSAQLPLHTWLPDAMEGPTPVSALIHAATMVTAGVYLVARCAPIYDHSAVAASVVAVVGALTLLFAATIGCVQYDIKRVLAYSTMSQIGYMMLGVGVGAYAQGEFHFTTHAFFKALLFMAAGIVIHNLGGEQDIRKMGGLALRMPLAFWTFAIGTAAIAGVPLFSGFFSKDAIIDATLRSGHTVLWLFAVVGAGLTAFYMARLLFVTFFGVYRGEHEPHADRVWTMDVPVVVLAALSVGGGYAFGFERAAEAFASPMWLATTAMLLAGAGLAYVMYVLDAGVRERAHRVLGGVRDLMADAYRVDALYDALFQRPAYALARALDSVVETYVVAGIPRAAVATAALAGELSRHWETGYVRRYGLSLVLGAVLLLAAYAIVALVHPSTLGGR